MNSRNCSGKAPEIKILPAGSRMEMVALPAILCQRWKDGHMDMIPSSTNRARGVQPVSLNMRSAVAVLTPSAKHGTANKNFSSRMNASKECYQW